jgi:hypothetical protein
MFTEVYKSNLAGTQDDRKPTEKLYYAEKTERS